MRLTWSGRICTSKRNPTLLELRALKVAGIWEESYRFYLGGSQGKVRKEDSEMTTHAVMYG